MILNTQEEREAEKQAEKERLEAEGKEYKDTLVCLLLLI